MKVLVTGASGFVGQVVVQKLLEARDQVVVLTRNVAKAESMFGKSCQYIQWSGFETPLKPEELVGIDGVINLMGEGLADKPWSEEQKKKIYDSRIQGTKRLIEAFKSSSTKPKALISASAVGVYGNRGNEEIKENATEGNDFLAHVCHDWEQEAIKAEALGVRVVLIRTGVVLGKDGGALKKMLLPFKLGVGGRLGSGQQYMSWIHIEDLASLYVECLKNSNLSGAFNGTAPKPVTNAEFTKTLGHVLHRPTIFPVPGMALKAIFGEMSTVLLDGQKVIPARALENHFVFNHPALEEALQKSIN